MLRNSIARWGIGLVIIASCLGGATIVPSRLSVAEAAGSCGTQWHENVGGIDLFAHSCIDFPDGSHYHGYGESWAGTSINTIGTRNQGGQTCNGVFAWDYDTGWAYAYSVSYHQNGNTWTLDDCSSGHTYTSASDHYFDLTGEQVTPSTNFTQ